MYVSFNSAFRRSDAVFTEPLECKTKRLPRGVAVTSMYRTTGMG